MAKEAKVPDTDTKAYIEARIKAKLAEQKK